MYGNNSAIDLRPLGISYSRGVRGGLTPSGVVLAEASLVQLVAGCD